MKSTITYIVIIGMFLCQSCTQAPNRLSGSELSEGWELLFDGQTLDNWKNYNSDETSGWIVEDGTLAAKGDGSDGNGYIISRKQYDNFNLKFDWKIAEGGNSGLLYHVIESPNFSTPYLTGPEYQLIDDIGFPERLEEWQKAGAGIKVLWKNLVIMPL